MEMSGGKIFRLEDRIQNAGKSNLSRAVYRAFKSYTRMQEARYILPEPQISNSDIIDTPELPVRYDSDHEQELFSRVHA